MENKPKNYAKQLIINDMAVRVGFEPTIGTWNLQLADSSLPGVPYLPGLPPRIAQNCPSRQQCHSAPKCVGLGTARALEHVRPNGIPVEPGSFDSAEALARGGSRHQVRNRSLDDGTGFVGEIMAE